MPLYIGKKARKQQRADAEYACLHHEPWKTLFFDADVDAARAWLHSPTEQPLVATFSDTELFALTEMLLPVRRTEVFAEHFRVTFCRNIHLFVPPSVPLAPPSLSAARLACAPPSLYERLVEVMFECDIYLDTDVRPHQLLLRPLLFFWSLLAARERSLRFLESEIDQYTVFARADVVALERAVCQVAWDFMLEQTPVFAALDDFLKAYDLVFGNIVAVLRPGPDNGLGADACAAMRTRFIHMLCVEKRAAFLAANPFRVLHAEKWDPIAQRVLLSSAESELVAEPNCDYYPCVRCKSRRVYVQILQLRSSDEAATILVTCVECKARFTARN